MSPNLAYLYILNILLSPNLPKFPFFVTVMPPSKNSERAQTVNNEAT